MGSPVSFAGFVDDVDDREKSLSVINREEIDPIQQLLEDMFDADAVSVVDGNGDPAGPADVVVLHDEDRPAIATSTLQSVEQSLLMVNSDLYITGARSLEDVDTPDVVVNLGDVTFSVADKQKFLLIHISRHIEAMAYETEGGVLHSGFQELSRLIDERGTERAYQQLADRGLDVHVYGSPDWDDPLDYPVSVHTHSEGEILKSWFVVHDGDGDDDRKAALVAVETGRNEYCGFWTFETDIVDDVLAYIDRTYGHE
jgi:hypothetical protein